MSLPQMESTLKTGESCTFVQIGETVRFIIGQISSYRCETGSPKHA